MTYEGNHDDDESICVEDLLEEDFRDSTQDQGVHDLGQSCDTDWDQHSSMSSFTLSIDLGDMCGISVLGEPDDGYELSLKDTTRMTYEGNHDDDESICVEDLLEEDFRDSTQDQGVHDLGQSCNTDWDQHSSMSSFTLSIDLGDMCGISVLGEPYDGYDDELTEISLESDDEQWVACLTAEITIDPMQQCCREASSDYISIVRCDSAQEERALGTSMTRRESKRSLVMAKMLGLESSLRELGQQLRRFDE